MEKEVDQQLKQGENFVYWQSQNPIWVSSGFTLLPLIFLVTAVFLWTEAPWLTIEFLVIGVALKSGYSGMRTLVNREYITVRYRILGIKILRIGIAYIKEVNVQEFSAFRNFGGMGIRFNGQMKAYFLRGSRGVKITTINEKRYL